MTNAMYSTMKLSSSCETAVDAVARSHTNRSPVTRRMRWKISHVDELADEERDDRSADGPHALAEQDCVGLLDIGHAHALFTSTQNVAGASEMAAYAARNE